MNHPRVNVPAPEFCSYFPNHFLAPNFFCVSFDIDPFFLLDIVVSFWVILLSIENDFPFRGMDLKGVVENSGASNWFMKAL